MGRPRFDYMQRQQRDIARWVGETATYRAFASAVSQGVMSEAAGVGASAYYVQRLVTGLFSYASPPFVENYFPGGTVITGDVFATLIDCVPNANDEITWQGVNYRVVGTPIPQHIAGQSAYRMLLRRGQATP